MPIPRSLAIFTLGAIGCGLASLVIVAPSFETAHAQTNDLSMSGSVGRYQISAYGYGLGDGSPGSLSEHGAYILDTQTGDIFVIRHHGGPKFLGSVGKERLVGGQPLTSPDAVQKLPAVDSIELPNGLSSSEATNKLLELGFHPWEDATVPNDNWVRFRKPWQRGFHFINLRFENDKLVEVGELRNDP